MRRRAKGSGTIFKKKDGRWAAEINVPLANGGQKRVYISSKNREIVRAKLNKIRNDKTLHIPFTEKEWTVGDYFDYWLQNIQSKRIRETTMASYSLIIKNHIKPTLGGIKLRNLSVYDVRHALDTLEKRGCRGAVLQKYYQVLCTCLNCAKRDKLIHDNMALLVDKPKYIPEETAIWRVAEATHFLQTAREHPKYIAFLLLLTYGMRRGEVLGLRFSDIDFENNLIYVRQQINRINGRIVACDVKTTNSRRVLPLVPNVRFELMECIKKRNIILPEFNPKFTLGTQGTVVVSEAGTPLEPRNLARCFEIITKKAGLPRIKIHAIRHTTATILKDLEIPIKDAQLILGHANISTTLNIYTHGTPETQRNAIYAVEDRLLSKQTTLAIA
jgi:integrase